MEEFDSRRCWPSSVELESSLKWTILDVLFLEEKVSVKGYRPRTGNESKSFPFTLNRILFPKELRERRTKK